MPSSNPRQRFVIETVDDQPVVPAPIQDVIAPPPQVQASSGGYTPGSYRQGLHQKLHGGVVEAVEEAAQTPQRPQEPVVPAFLQAHPSTLPQVTTQVIQEPIQENHEFVDPGLEKFPSSIHGATPTIPTPASFTRKQGAGKAVESVSAQLSHMTSLVMNVPAFITVALILTVLSFFAGRFSSGPTKQASAQGLVSASATPAASVAPTLGTPDEIIKQARADFTQAQDISKNSSATDADKQKVSTLLVGVIDQLTKGIAAYPDVASLYFERAQMEKMVMQSAPTLKNQASDDYQKALALSPLTSEYYLGYADYLQTTGDAAGALGNYQKATQLDPKNTDALYAVAKLEVSQGQQDAALATYNSLLRMIPQSSSSYAQLQQERDALVPAQTPVASSSATPITSTPTATASAKPGP